MTYTKTDGPAASYTGSRHSTATQRDKKEIKLFSGFAHVARSLAPPTVARPTEPGRPGVAGTVVG